MVDPASGSQQQQQQQPPTLSITVVPLNVLDDPLGAAQELDGDDDEAGGGGLVLHPLSEAAILEASQSLYDDIVDDVILGIVFEVHRGAKLGLTALLEDGLTGDNQCDFDADDTTRSSAGGGGGEALDFDAASEMLSSAAINSKKPAECVCPNCQRNMAASRFAPHLEKCMGMGRNSSRLASRRIATSASRQADLVSDDDVDDDDWTAGGAGDRQDHRIMSGEGGGGGGGGKNKRRHHLHKKDKNSPRRKKWKNNSNGDNNHSNSNSSGGHPSLASSASTVPGADGNDGLNAGGTGIEAMGLSERRTNLLTMCGVISEHTGRMCTRSLRCPQHTDSQRKNVRQVMLESHAESDGHLLPAIGDKEKEMIDVDTWEEGDSLASLLTAQSHDVPTPGAEASPAESTSTSASSTSSSARRREQHTNIVNNNKANSKKNNSKKFKGDA